MIRVRTSNINWQGMALAVGAVLVMWTGMAELIPANIYKPVSIVVTALQSCLLFLMRSGNVADSHDSPGGGQ